MISEQRREKNVQFTFAMAASPPAITVPYVLFAQQKQGVSIVLIDS
jgi:hypothetical protein